MAQQVRLAAVEYEHKSVEIPDGANLEDYAAGGWELVSAVRAMRMDYVVTFWKRRK